MIEIMDSRALRQAKREARKEKQRKENIGRAAKMHEARLAARMTERNYPGISAARQYPVMHIGCSGWYYWHWRSCFYPSTISTSQWFPYYSSHFKTVELNAPFYSWPTIATVKNWLRQVGQKKFIYTIKVCELITHIKRFENTRELIEDFGYIADLLGIKMGCFLFQLPPSFHYTPERLTLILGQLDFKRRNVIEFRHASWWNEEVYEAFFKAGVIFCSCSGPKLPDELIKTADDIYIRFHGKEKWYRHDYSKEELAVWADRICKSGAKRVWAYFNNDRDCHAIKNARELIRQLKRT